MPLLNDILIIFALSVVALLLCSRFHVPSIVGFILAGVLAGPHGLGLVSSIHEVDTLAEIGVMLLLFTIGVEFSLRRLLEIKRLILWGGGAQMVLTILVCYAAARWLGRSPREAVFWGFLFSMSSTAIVLKLLQEKAEIDSPHGRAVLAILIFQDLMVVPMILLIPFLAGQPGGHHESLLLLAARGAAIFVFVIASAKWIVPYLLYQTARTRSREIFLLAIILVCLSAAWLTYHAGLSLALGAFLAGLIISESEYNHQTLGNIIPFRDVFTSFFFISIGMLFDLGLIFSRPILMAAAVVGIIAGKAALTGAAALILRLPLKSAALIGLALAQVGEFSFICSRLGLEKGLIDAGSYQWFLSLAVLSMGLTPVLISFSEPLSELALRLPLPARLKNGAGPPGPLLPAPMKQHLVIIGYGLNGKNLARAARSAGIPYVIIEMNPETVKAQQARGEPIYYGDAAQEAVLASVNFRDAKIAAIAINDPAATRGIVAACLGLNPRIHLIVRTRYVQEIEPLKKLGAHEVIPEEFETSIEIFARVLAQYLVPRNEIEKLVGLARSEGYEMLRSLSPRAKTGFDLAAELPDMEVSFFRIPADSSIAGKTLGDLELRKKHGVTALAIRSKDKVETNPSGDTSLCPDDVLFLFGSPGQIAAATELILGEKKKGDNS
jgi:CPA2 family monovalent cation:H+ antiporter-2